jgi:hypothetical protein
MYSSRTLRFFYCAALVVGLASVSLGQATRTWVSGVGDDANPCSRTAPCKTWAGAISKTANGGEIDALDPGGFGTLTITKPITIDGTGTLASILNSGVNGINVNLTTAPLAGHTATVNIRGISINGAGTTLGINGINYLLGANLNVMDCLIMQQSGDGIHYSMSSNSNIYVRNSVIKDCQSDGIEISTSSGTAKGLLDHVGIAECGVGIHAKQNSRLSAVYCSVTGNAGAGVFSEGVGAVAVVNIGKSEISNNVGAGVQGGGGGSTQLSIVRISDNELHTNSGTGALVSTNGEIDTWSNNRIFSNGADGCVGCLPKGPN